MHWFTGIWPLVEHFGLGATAIVALLAAAWFVPVFKKDFLYGAAIVAISMTVYAVGVRDEKHRRDALDAAAQSVVDEAVRDAGGKKDPNDDPRN